jgi:hypothetical protein
VSTPCSQLCTFCIADVSIGLAVRVTFNPLSCLGEVGRVWQMVLDLLLIYVCTTVLYFFFLEFVLSVILCVYVYFDTKLWSCLGEWYLRYGINKSVLLKQQAEDKFCFRLFFNHIRYFYSAEMHCIISCTWHVTKLLVLNSLSRQSCVRLPERM